MPAAVPSAPPSPRETSEEATFTPTPHGSSDVRRVHARFTVDLDVTLGSQHNFYAGFAENLSAGGIFVATHKILPVGEVLMLSIRLPRLTRPIEGAGEVRWVREYSERSNVPPGLGLRFVEIAPAGIEAIHRFLENRDPLFFDD